MCDDKDEQPLLETVGDKIGEQLPERLRNSEGFAYGLGTICGFLSGWFIVRKAAELLFGKDQEK